jgi:hypothetical protein
MSQRKFFRKSPTWYVFSGLLGMALVFATSVAKADVLTVQIIVTSDGDGLPPGVRDMVTVVDVNTNGNVLPPLTVQATDDAGVTFFNKISGFNWQNPSTVVLTPFGGSAESDIVTLINQGNDAFIYFTSDAFLNFKSDDDGGQVGGVPHVPDPQTLQEGANGVTAFTAQGATSVPEPSSVVLLATVVFGVGLLIRRRPHRAPCVDA